MTRDDVIRMARLSVIDLYGPMPDEKMYDVFIERCAKFAHLVAAAEREACIDDCHAEATAEGIAQRIIERIRARGQA
jgi:hypothetical protein